MNEIEIARATEDSALQAGIASLARTAAMSWISRRRGARPNLFACQTDDPANQDAFRHHYLNHLLANIWTRYLRPG
jgi:hypothetical protein